MSLPIWEYKICDCAAQITKRGGLFREQKGFWTLDIDGETTGLQEGLERLGQKGWELAGIQTVRTEDHDRPHQIGYPKSFYVFKRPI